MPTLPEEIVDEVRKRAAFLHPLPHIRSVAISLGYTYVELSNEIMGVCFTPRSASASCAHYAKAGTLANSDIFDLMALMLSNQPLERSVGIAAVNAVSQTIMALEPEKYPVEETDFLDLLPFNGGRPRVGMVGNIGPFVSFLSQRADSLVIIDDNPFLIAGPQSGNCITSRNIKDLAEVDLLIITGSSAAVGDFDEVLASARAARFIGVVGPSAGWLPDPAFRRGVCAVAATRIIDLAGARQVILEGGGTQHFTKYGQKYTLTNGRPW
jgi:uncharacterized protein (DUF4213/DUF364 family)